MPPTKRLLLSLLSATLTTLASGANLLVSTVGQDVVTCGANSTHPCRSLAYVLQHVARPGDEIELASGVYTETTPRAITFGSTAVHDVKIIAKDTDVTIDRAYNGNFTPGGLMAFSEGAHTVEFVNCAFEHHRIAASGFAARGGVGNILGGTPHFVNCSFRDNWAGVAGAFYVAGDASPVFEDCLFADSGCIGGWAGVLCPEGASTGTWTRCTFRNNTCGFGGVIDDGLFSASEFVDCTFEDNFAPYYGGVYYGYGSARTKFDGCLFRNNRVAEGADGQDVFLSVTVTAVFENSRFEAGDSPQFASGGASGRVSDSSSVLMKNCTVQGYQGVNGAYQVDVNASATFDSCVFTNNSATNGGVLSIYRPTTIRDCQFINNTATTAGAVYIGGPFDGAPIPVDIQKCVFAGNKALSTAGAIYVNGRAVAQMSDTALTDNVAKGVGGGALYVRDSAILISRNDSFVANIAPVGGAIWTAGFVDVSSAKLIKNAAETTDDNETCGSAAGNGGAIFVSCTGQRSVVEARSGSNPCLAGMLQLSNLSMTTNYGVEGGGGAIFLHNDVPACVISKDVVCQDCVFADNDAMYGPDVATDIAALTVENTSQVYAPLVVNVGVQASGSDLVVTLVSNRSRSLRSGLATFKSLQLQMAPGVSNTKDTSLVIVFSAILSGLRTINYSLPITLAKCPDKGLVGDDGRCSEEMSSRTRTLVAASIIAAFIGCLLAFLLMWASKHPEQVIQKVRQLIKGVAPSVAQIVLQVLDFASDVMTLINLLVYDVGLSNVEFVRAVYGVCVALAAIPSFYLLRATIRLVQVEWQRTQSSITTTAGETNRASISWPLQYTARQYYFKCALARFFFGDIVLSIANAVIYVCYHGNLTFLQSNLRITLECALALGIFHVGSEGRAIAQWIGGGTSSSYARDSKQSKEPKVHAEESVE
ncbi:TPA: hypothetical protein N0F65_007443 [Lagenidium giganteum]|uniref:Right handed beta helix domain-containing protein n=1 Tax=Lagenidium giganteum TaxID=4803 RepID=A0AAV2ZHE6_9STRA|nr:TPA: hypothetical protein N0F65_007443 [Lagenidium giganteum]